MDNGTELRLTIDGMHCGGCVRRVTAALARVQDVEVREVEVGSAVVDYDPAKVEAREVVDAVNAIGFTARQA